LADTRSFTPSGRPGPDRPPSSGRKQPARMTGVPVRRQLPYLLMGVLLVLGCTVGGAVVAAQVGDQEPVLVLARSVTVGQVLSERDLREVSVSSDRAMTFVPVRARSAVLGRPVAYSLPAGILLTRDVLGPSRVPPEGEAVAAVGLKAGQFPPEVQAGNHVTVVVAPDKNGATPEAGTSAWPATVTDVRPETAGQTSVLSLLMAEADARAVAAVAADRIGVVTVHGDGR